MSENQHPQKLGIEDVRFDVSPDSFGYATTAELEPLDEIVGQPRAMRALDLGLGVRHPNYHIYVAGMTGTGKLEILRRALTDRTRNELAPADWIYVNNFDSSDRPLAIPLKSGQGIHFKHDVEALIDTLVDALPKAFRHEDFGREKDRLRKAYRQRGEEVLGELDKIGRAHV